MVGSIGVVPLTAIAVAAAAPMNWTNLANAFNADGSDLVAGLDGSRVPISMSRNLRGPVEVVVALEGNSLATEQSKRMADGRAELDGAGQKAYVASLRNAQAGVKATLQAAGVQILHEYRIVFNGFHVVADRAILKQALSIPGVSHFEPVQIATPELAFSVPFILGGASYDDIGADGTGMTIAVIDTGIDYTHAAFGGSGDPNDYATNDPTVIEAGTFPTDKVLGGTDLVGEFYDTDCPAVPPEPGVCSSIPDPDPDPLDINGHGTHVSSIAAGMETAFVAHGVAPGASLYMFKVFALGSTSSANVIAAIEMASDPDGDGDTSDHVDVINMSLGSPYGRTTDTSAVAANAAVALGVIVVASAGNSGNLPYFTGSPASATNAISVAAGNDPGITLPLVAVANSAGADGDRESVEGAFTRPLAEAGVTSGIAVRLGDFNSAPARLCTPLEAGSLTGKIPLIARGVCTFQVKISNAEAAGAIAAVVYNNVAGDAIVMGGTAAGIPGFMVSNVDGAALTAAIDEDTTFTLDPDHVLSVPDRLQGFTSRGPRFGDGSLKPDVTAPGGSVFAAAAGSGDDGVDISGTSMASPHVAGAAALLRSLHPKWSVAEIKSALMNTATDAQRGGVPYAVALQGAGRVQVDVAAETSSVVIPGSASFGVRESDRTSVKTFTTDLQVRNKGSSSKTFDVTAEFRTPGQNDGSITLIHPDSISVSKGRSKGIEFSLRVDYRLIPAGFVERDGFLTLTQRGGGDVLRVPFHILPTVRSSASASDHDARDDFRLRNRGLSDTLVDIYQLGVEDRNENLIREARGLPNDPDDWFDIRATGAHVFDDPDIGRILEFAIATQGLRSVANIMVTEIWIDANDDDVPDYLVQVADFGLVTSPSFDAAGRMVSAVFELTSGNGFLEFFVANPRNTGLQTAPIVLDDLNFLGTTFGGPTIDADNPTFSYFADTIDLETGAMDATKSATFNAIDPAVDADPQFSLLAAGTSATITVLGSGKGDLLVLYYNNVAGRSQTQIIDVERGHGDHDD
jgi:subtilisin family serine protease